MDIKYDCVDLEQHLYVDNIHYIITVVEDHLEDITKAMATGLTHFARGGAVALDFSDLRPRGSKTSHGDGESTGAASFAKTFADMVQILSNVNAEKRYKPIIMLDEGHADFKEFEGINSDAVLKITHRRDDWRTL